jgi:hypothetical protein
MSTWHLRPEDRRRTHHWFLVDDKGAAAFLIRWALKDRPFRYVQEEVSEIWIDGGGAVGADEPAIRWRANDNTLGTFLRQVPFVLATLKQTVESTKVQGAYFFSGWTHSYLLGQATRDESISALEKILKDEDGKIKAMEAEWSDRLNSTGGTLYLGKCSCQSGKPYVECCGKEKTVDEN